MTRERITFYAPQLALLPLVLGGALVLLSQPVAASSVPDAAAERSTLQESSSGSSKPVSVSVGEANGYPDADVVLPVSLSRAADAPDGSIRIQLTFPEAQLNFVKVEPSGVAVAAGVTARAKVTKGAAAEPSMLEVTIATAADAKPRRPLPSGRIAELVFHIEKHATRDAWIPLTHQATASSTDDPPKPIEPVVAYRTRIAVSTPPISACFFYMH
jgi:hypothetical protein